MTIAEIRDTALALSAVTEDIKWENHLCFSVGAKMFLVTSPDSFPPTAAFKVDAEEFEEIINREGFTRHSHLGRHNWVQLDDISRLQKSQWQACISQSYKLVVAKLPKKLKATLNL